MKRALPHILDYLKKADMFLLALCVISSMVGIVLVWSSTQNSAAGALQLTVQIGAFLLGLALFVLFSAIDVEILAQRWKLLLAFNLILLLLLFFFGVGDEVGSANWLRFGPIGIQPSELIKITFIIMMAYHIHYIKEYRNLNSFFSLVILVAHFSYLLILLPDLGNTLIFLFIFLVMLFLAGVYLRWFAFGTVLVALLSPVLWRAFGHYQQMRILAPFDPTIDPLNQSWNFQAHRSRIAIASGQASGQGLGQGIQTQGNAIPEQHTDFIFSVAGEEFGMIGALVLILLLTLIVLRCFYVAAKSRNTLQGLVCAGVGAFILFQSLVNIGMNLNLTPVIGIALPFFGYGGSSLVSTFAAMGIVCGVKMRTVSPWKRQLN